MGIFDEKLHVFWHMNMYDDGSIILNIELKIV